LGVRERTCILPPLTDPLVRGFYYPNSARPAAVGVLVWKAISSQSGPRKAQCPPAARANWLKHHALASRLRQLWCRQGYTSNCAQSASRTAAGAKIAAALSRSTARPSNDRNSVTLALICDKKHIEDLLLGLYRRCNNSKGLDFSGYADRLTSQTEPSAPHPPNAPLAPFYPAPREELLAAAPALGGRFPGPYPLTAANPLFAPSLPPLHASVVKGAGSVTEGSARLLQC
jgi:hypothetical protein